MLCNSKEELCGYDLGQLRQFELAVPPAELLVHVYFIFQSQNFPGSWRTILSLVYRDSERCYGSISPDLMASHTYAFINLLARLKLFWYLLKWFQQCYIFREKQQEGENGSSGGLVVHLWRCLYDEQNKHHSNLVCPRHSRELVAFSQI